MRYERYGYNVYLETFMKSGYAVSIFVEQTFFDFRVKEILWCLVYTSKRKELLALEEG